MHRFPRRFYSADPRTGRQVGAPEWAPVVLPVARVPELCMGDVTVHANEYGLAIDWEDGFTSLFHSRWCAIVCEPPAHPIVASSVTIALFLTR